MPTNPTPACTALVKTKDRLPAPPGTLCGKTTGTTPTPDGPRCFTHARKDQHRQDPGSRPPVKAPKTVLEMQRNVVWAMGRAAQNLLSAPNANAVTAAIKLWRLLNADK